jgi:hypothetical protein
MQMSSHREQPNPRIVNTSASRRERWRIASATNELHGGLENGDGATANETDSRPKLAWCTVMLFNGALSYRANAGRRLKEMSQVLP